MAGTPAAENAPCTIGGILLDTEGEPAAGVEIICIDGVTSAATAHTTKTDRNGRFLFLDVPSSPCHLLARPSTTAPPRLLRHLDPAEFGRHALANLDCRLGPAASITVIVTDKAGEPVAGARVTFVQEIVQGLDRFDIADALGYTTTTNADGRAVAATDSASHMIVVSKPSFATRVVYEDPSADGGGRLRGFRGGFGGGFGRFGFSPRPVEEHTPGIVKVVLQPAATVTGRVLDPKGRPVPGATVQCRHDYTNDLLGSTTADEDGAFKMDDVAAGTYSLCAEADGVGAGFVADVRMPPGRVTGPVTVTLKPYVVVEGRIVDPAGKPIEGAAVALYARATAWVKVGSATSGADGTFRFDQVPGGELYVSARKDDRVPESYQFTQADLPLTITLSRAPRLTGVVVRAGTNRPVRGATVLIFESSWEKRAAWTDRHGRFAADLFAARAVCVLAFTDELCTPSLLRVDLQSDKTADIRIELQPAESVSGVVVEADRGGPIRGATVCFSLDDDQVGHMSSGLTVPKPSSAADTSDDEDDDESEQPLFSAVTDPDGAFRIPFLIDVHDEVTVQAGGCLTIRRPVSDLDLTRPLRFELERGLALKGRVISTTGEPIEGADVCCLLMLDERRGLKTAFTQNGAAETDADGRFEITNLTPGRCQVGATHGRFTSAAIDDLELRRGSPIEDVTLTLTPGAFISGEVVDEDGVPVMGWVSIHSETGDDEIAPIRSGIWLGSTYESGQDVETAEDGRYRSSPLKAGRYTVTASAGSHLQAEPQIVELAEGETRDGVNFVLPCRAGQVSGMVVDESGAPINGAELEAEMIGRDLDEFDDTKTDDQGRFTFAQTGTGRMQLTTNVDGYMEKRCEIDAPAADLVIVLERLPAYADLTIIGRVIDAVTGEPVTLYELDYRRDCESIPDPTWYGGDKHPDGRFELKSMLAGRYAIAVRAKGYAPCTISDIQLAVDEPLDELVFALDRGATVAFTITSEADGTPVRGAEVVCERGHYGDRPQSDAAGVCRIDGLGPGTYAFLIAHDDFAVATASVEVSPGDEDIPVSVTLGAGFAVRGRVVAAGSHEPIPDAEVRLARQPDEGFYRVDQDRGTARTDADGAFVIDRVRAGSFDLIVDHDDYVQYAQHLDLSGPLGEVIIELTSGGAVAGLVTSPDGTPLPGIEVHVERYDGTTGQDGRYRIDHVPAGQHRAAALRRDSAAGQVPPVASVTVVDGQTVQLDFVVGAGVTLSGTVTQAGKPLSGVDLYLGDETDQYVYTRSGADGRYKIESVPPGRWTVEIAYDDFQRGGWVERYRPIEIGTDDVVYDIEIGGGAVSGVVRAASGQPACGADITISPAGKAPDRADVVMSAEPDTDSASASTDVKGRFSFASLSPGKHTLTVTAERHAEYTTTVDIPESGAASPLDIRLEPEAAVVIHVTASGGDLPGEVDVTAYDTNGRQLDWSRIDLDADTRQARVGGLGAGRQYICVSADGFAPCFMPVSTAVGVETPANVQLRRGRTLNVAIVDPSGAAIENARIGLDCTGPIALVRALNETIPHVWTEAPDGTSVVSLEQLPNGAYTLHIRCPGYEDAAQPVTIAGADAQVTVTLKRRSE